MSCASHFVCKTELAAILGCSVSYLDRLRKKFGNQYERRIGPHSSVEINTTEWMKLWAENRKRGLAAPFRLRPGFDSAPNRTILEVVFD
jgi:hypothetical protein